MSPFLWAVVGLLLAERAVEIWINRRNSAILRARGARWLGGDDGFVLILVAQVALFVGTTLEGSLAPYAGVKPWTWPLVGVLAAAQVLRYWCIGTLGWRWSIRVVTLPGAPRVADGPYRWFPHPNYAAVMAESLALPLAFGAYGTLLVAAPLQLAAIRRRVRLEEKALAGAEAAAPA
ncbi:MAG TPA: isoprenylcysteine carboxylmethyltransferase family protein [Candidatus Thermoplasmatota archaeon]|nr:isoprenylcysteine carboxylmethyltransferase family protein [Candidatus Thermoplasmatota archaeon]